MGNPATNGAAEVAPLPLPEAPASATLKIELRGYEVLFTLRDTNGRDLLAKVNAAIDAIEGMGGKPATPPVRGGGNGGAPKKSVPVPADGSAPTCPDHGAMRQGQYGWFCPKRQADGSYCPFKAK